MPRTAKKIVKQTTVKKPSYLDRIEAEVQSNQSRMSLILGALIIFVVGILIFNYFNRNKAEVGPAQQSETTQSDVTIDKLPGKYTVKEGDTLFTIAEKYYNDGYQFTEIAKANNLVNVDSIEVGQVLEIPKIDLAQASIEPSPTAEASPILEVSPTPTASEAPAQVQETAPAGEKGAEIVTDWGLVITGNTYTVQEGDWLSTIAARAYNGDIFAYEKLAQVNNIPNPDYIEPGMVINIPR